MQMRNGSAPKGIDLGPSSPPVVTRYSGSFVASVPHPDPLPDDYIREKGRFAYKPTDDPDIERKREQWRRAQLKRRQKLSSQSSGSANA